MVALEVVSLQQTKTPRLERGRAAGSGPAKRRYWFCDSSKIGLYPMGTVFPDKLKTLVLVMLL